MKKIVTILGLVLTSSAVFSMPCDTGYLCKSKSGKYEIALQRCRYVNNLQLSSLKIDNLEITDATLAAAFDGQSVGGNVLAFEINLPTTDDSTQVLSTEIVGRKGVIKSKYAESMPARLEIKLSESIKCEVAE